MHNMDIYVYIVWLSLVSMAHGITNFPPTEKKGLVYYKDCMGKHEKMLTSSITVQHANLHLVISFLQL